MITFDKASAMGVQGKPGRLVELRKFDIRTPHEYQRDLSKKHVSRIAREFNWYLFGTLILAHRPDPSTGAPTYFVVDGQHRLEGAKQVEEIDLVPAMLYDFDGPEAEAEIFWLLQHYRKPLVTRDMHKAELFVGGDFGRVAWTAEEFLGTLDCASVPLATLRQLIAQKPEAFARLAPILPDLVGLASLKKDFIEAAVYLEDVLGPEESLADKHMAALFDAGYEPLTVAIEAREKATRVGPSKTASPRMKAEMLRWALFQQGHETPGEIGARILPTMTPDEAAQSSKPKAS